MNFATALPPTARAALWMTCTALSFTFMAVGGRELSDTMSAFEVSFFRAFGGLLIVTALLGRSGFAQLHTVRLLLHLLRNVFHFGGQTLWFFGLTLMPLATVFALEFTIPFWTAFFAAMFLGERLHHGRVVAIALGFVGIVVILKPGTDVFDASAFVVLAAAVGFSVSNVCSKPLAGTETPLAIIFYMNVIQLPLGLVAASFDWVWPDWSDLPWLVVVGTAGLTAHFCMTRAFRLADATFVMPIDYLRLPFAVGIGFALYGESVGWELWLGAAIILAGNLYSLRSEARRVALPR